MAELATSSIRVNKNYNFQIDSKTLSLNVYLHIPLFSVRPIVRTSRTAFVCGSDYDDRTQFYMFEQKKRTWIKILFKEITGLSVLLPVRKSEKKSLVTYLFHQRGNTADPLQIHLSERAEAMLRCGHCCCG